MKKAFLLLSLIVIVAAMPGYADDDDVQARRELRDRRARVREAHRRIQKCLVDANIEPCFQNVDLSAAQALMAYYERRNRIRPPSVQVFRSVQK